METGFNKFETGIFIERRFNNDDMSQFLKHKRSKKLTLTGLKLESLDFLLNMKELEDLKLYSCTIGNSSALCELKKLKFLFFNGVRKPNDNFSFLTAVTSLEKLGIGYATYFEKFPDLSDCKKLKELQFFNCKNLVDISNVTKIPYLERFDIVVTPQKPNDLEFIMQKPTIKFMAGAFGGKKINDEFEDMLTKYGIQYG
jgi:hypothetical protein